jgi:hypothetical protein
MVIVPFDESVGTFEFKSGHRGRPAVFLPPIVKSSPAKNEILTFMINRESFENRILQTIGIGNPPPNVQQRRVLSQWDEAPFGLESTLGVEVVDE